MANILIVDDDKDILRLMEFMLGRGGHEVNVSSSGPKGLEMVKSNPPDLIISDIMMPDMTGYEFTRQVKAMPHMGKVPIIIYSARFQDVDKQAALDAGATDYFPKTLPPPEIARRIEDLLRKGGSQANVQKGSTLAFFSLRGGVGVTSLAINVAVTLAVSHKIPIGLADLNPMAGHSGLMLKLRPQSHVYSVLNSEQPLSEALLKQHLTSHSSGVQLLASPLLPPEISAKHTMKDLVRQLSGTFKFNLLDLPHHLSPDILSLLPDITKLVVILSPHIPSLQSAVAAMQLLIKKGINQEKIALVLNRNTPVPGLTPDAIQRTLHRPVIIDIPFEANMITSINGSQPLVLYNAKSPTAIAIARLAAMLVKE